MTPLQQQPAPGVDENNGKRPVQQSCRMRRVFLGLANGAIPGIYQNQMFARGSHVSLGARLVGHSAGKDNLARPDPSWPTFIRGKAERTWDGSGAWNAAIAWLGSIFSPPNRGEFPPRRFTAFDLT